MKNLFNTIKDNSEKAFTEFVSGLQDEQSKATISDKWYYTNLLPKGRNCNDFATIELLKEYLIKRKRKAIDTEYLKESQRVLLISEAKEVESITITVEWKRSAMYGNNPKAECSVWYAENSFNRFQSSSISGCGYDKLSTAVSQCLNQINGILKPLYDVRDKDLVTSLRNLFGYGSGNGLLPRFEGGVGVSCYPRIFEKIGYKFETKASGKTFDVFEITKIKI